MREVIGIHACREALKVSGSSIVEVCLREGWQKSHELREMARFAEKAGLPVKTVGLKRLERLGGSHQGVSVRLKSAPQWDYDKLAQPGQQLVVILDEIADTNNLGAIMRTSWLMGASALFVSDRRSADLTPAVAKVASGAAEHLPVLVEKNFTSLFKDLKDNDFWIYGLSGQGNSDLWAVNLPEKVAWVVGSEAKGLRKTTERACDDLVRIPQSDSEASFNASVAAALALAETCRQWKNP